MIDKPPERRQFGRRSAFKSATMSATVLDLSQGGARIRVAQPEAIGKEFYLEIPENDFIVKCGLVHMQDTSIGAVFIRTPRRLSWLNK